MVAEGVVVEEVGCVEGLGLVSGGVACFGGFLLSYFISFYPILCHFILLILFCFILFYFILFYINLFRFQILLSLSPGSGARLESHFARE